MYVVLSPAQVVVPHGVARVRHAAGFVEEFGRRADEVGDDREEAGVDYARGMTDAKSE